MLLFHKMGTLIDLIGLSEVFFPRTDGHNTAAAIVVTGTEKCKEIVTAAIQGGIFQCLAPVLAVFLHGRICKMQTLPVSLPRFIDPVQQPGNSRNQCHPRKSGEE